MGLFDNVKILMGSGKNSPPMETSAPLPKKILIVEDEPMFSNALTLKFQNTGYQVFVAANGALGLEMLQSQKPDLVILDLMMPVMDGKTMLKKMREIPEFSKVPVFVLSNAGDSNTIMETKTYYNASEFLIKSNISLEEILTRVKRHLGS